MNVLSVRVLPYSLSIAARDVRNEKLYLRDSSLSEINSKWFGNGVEWRDYKSERAERTTEVSCQTALNTLNQ